jgi:hypothetical protein
MKAFRNNNGIWPIQKQSAINSTQFPVGYLRMKIYNVSVNYNNWLEVIHCKSVVETFF